MFWVKRKKPFTSLAITPPVASADREGIAIAVIVKDEAPYIKEWLLYHKFIGVRHFLIYDNGSADGTTSIVRSTLDHGDTTILPWKGSVFAAGRFLNNQVLAFAHAITAFGGQFARMAFIDVDEFLLPRQGGNLSGALAATADFPNVSLPWHMFGTSGHDAVPAGPVTLSYTQRGADPLTSAKHISNFKCIVDPCEVVEVSVHQFKTKSFGDITVNDQGFRATRDGRKKREFYSNTNLQLNHYFTKSYSEMKLKIERGSSYIENKKALSEKMLDMISSIERDLVDDRLMVEFIQLNRIQLR